MRYCVMHARLVGKVGSNRERNHATRPAELSTSDHDALKMCLVIDFSDQLLHFLDTAEMATAVPIASAAAPAKTTNFFIVPSLGSLCERRDGRGIAVRPGVRPR